MSNAFYVYLRDPDGHRLEIYTSDYYTGDPDHPVLDLDGNPRPATEQHQVLESAVGADGFRIR